MSSKDIEHFIAVALIGGFVFAGVLGGIAALVFNFGWLPTIGMLALTAAVFMGSVMLFIWTRNMLGGSK